MYYVVQVWTLSLFLWIWVWILPIYSALILVTRASQHKVWVLSLYFACLAFISCLESSCVVPHKTSAHNNGIESRQETNFNVT